MISLKISPTAPTPLARATSTYERSRIDSTCDRMVRHGNIQARSAATVRAMISIGHLLDVGGDDRRGSRCRGRSAARRR